jgi:hypothetical protein
VCPCSGKVEVACVLAEAGHVCQVILSIAHGLDDMTYPMSFDLHIGRNMDELHLALEVSKPFCCAPSWIQLIMSLVSQKFVQECVIHPIPLIFFFHVHDG